MDAGVAAAGWEAWTQWILDSWALGDRYSALSAVGGWRLSQSRPALPDPAPISPPRGTNSGSVFGPMVPRLPDGQITSDLRNALSSPKIKNISLFQKLETGYIYRHPVPLRGASAVVTNEGRVAVDAEAATDARGQSVRQRRVVLTPRGWRRRWQQYMAHRGERVISRKPIAQGMSDVLRCPVCSCAHFLCTLRMRSRVQRASGIPCAL